MGAPSLLTQCEVFTKPHLSINTDKPAVATPSSPSRGVSVTQSHSFSTTCILKNACSNLRREAVNSHGWFRSGISLKRSEKRSLRCDAYTKRGVEANYDYDLYQLLGIGKEAQAEEIKKAYRWLQKRCHPDIAGPRGHDMAILLNEAYAVLSDPHRRASYDATCSEQDEFEGYTGNPLYSRWYGKSGEDRAVFVEETRCIGCLKCALIAPNTFAIESKYGRARAVGQWLDEEGDIKDAIKSCPVDCISWVKKDMLPALEFIMSKQPRLNLSANSYSYVGVRRANVFQSAEKFVQKYAKREEVQVSGSPETPAQREARMAAVEAINIKAGRWWWHDLMGLPNLTFSNLWDSEAARVSQGALIPISTVRPSGGKTQFVDANGPERLSFDDDADLGPLFEAAKQRRQGTTGNKNLAHDPEDEEEYWKPNEPISCPLPLYTVEKKYPPKSEADNDSYVFVGQWSRRFYNFKGNLHESVRPIMSAVPVLASVTAAVLVGLNGGSNLARSESFVSGPLPAYITSGAEMQVLLTAVVWYMIAAVVCEVAVFATAVFVNFREKKRQE